MITIANLLRLPPFRKCRFLAGVESVENEVCGITLLENMDFSGKTMNNQLVLLGACFLEVLEESGVDYVGKCCREGVSAFCVRTVGEESLPEGFVRSAKEYKLPLILVRSDVFFDQIITAVTFEILRWDGYTQELSFEENFFQDLITFEKDEKFYMRRGAMLGLRYDEGLFALLIEQEEEKAAFEKIYRFIRNRFAKTAFFLTKNHRIMAAVRITDAESGRQRVAELSENILRILQEEFPDVRFHAGAGRYYKELVHFRKSFQEACSALSFNMFVKGSADISYFDDLGIYRILLDYKNRAELHQLYRDTIGVIEQHDIENQTEYLKTIRVYFQENYSISRAAKKLYVHYNTVISRFQRIKAHFGIDLYDERERINLFVCLVASDSEFLREDV